MAELVLPKIDAYAAAHSLPESAVRRALREETERTMEFARMLVGPLEGAFLHVLTRLTRAMRVLEIGMFTGYSALCLRKPFPMKATLSRARSMRSLQPWLGDSLPDHHRAEKSRYEWGPRWKPWPA